MKVRFQIDRVLFPRTGLVVGQYSIISCKCIEVIEGTKPVSDTMCDTFTMLSNTPVEFNRYDTYTGVFKEKNTKYGVSYDLTNLDIQQRQLNTEGAKRAFIESVFTPLQVESLYAKYDNPYDLIANKDTQKLMSVKGIGRKSVNKIYQKFDNNLRYQLIIAELNEYQLTKATMDSLLKRYLTPELVVEKVKKNIYILADEVEGIGFLRADSFALKKGVPLDSPERIKAFIKYFLEQQGEAGNSWVPPKTLFKAIKEFLKIPLIPEIIKPCLYNLQETKILRWNEEKTKIGLTKFYDLEKRIETNLFRLSSASINNDLTNRIFFNKIQEEYEKEVGFELTDQQKAVAYNLLSHQVSVLVGFPGTGKSCLIGLLASLYKSKKLSFSICSLSGKAAARVEEATGYAGSTIHRLLKYDPITHRFVFDKDNPLPCDMVIVDESSFLGGELFLSLLEALKTGTRLVLVGDDKQLPSIGACNVFHDIILSKKIPVYYLTKIHRQAAKSGIITSSAEVREGHQLVKRGWEGKQTFGELQDFTIDSFNARFIGEPKIIQWLKELAPTQEDIFDTQVIVPMKNRSMLSSYHLNNRIQEIYNPPSPFKQEVKFANKEMPYTIRVGDKVINRKNNYSAVIYKENISPFGITPPSLEEKTQNVEEIFNGYCGKVIKILNNKDIVVELGGGRLVFK